MPSPRPKKSTTVRLMNFTARLAETLAPAWVEERAFARWARPQKPEAKWGPELAQARVFRLEAGGSSLAAWEWNVSGQLGTALLVHGWSGNAAQLGSFVLPLVAQGYHVVAVDLPSHGANDGDFATLPLLADTVSSLGHRLRPRLVVAHSLGATASILALTEGPLPERLVALAPPAQLPPYLAHFTRAVGLSEAMLQRLLGRVERYIRRPVSELDLRRLAPSLGRVRALVVHDRADVVVPVSSSEELVKLWPSARLVVTEGLSHDRVRRDARVIEEVVGFAVQQAPVDGDERRSQSPAPWTPIPTSRPSTHPSPVKQQRRLAP